MHGIEIEVVGGLVEQQRRWGAEERLGKQHADFLSTLQFAHFALVQRVFDAQACEQNGGIGFRRVAALFADDAFEFTQAHAILVGKLVGRLGIKHVALLEGLPERGIAHNHGVDHAKLVKSELILAEDANFLGARNTSFGGLYFARQDLHES